MMDLGPRSPLTECLYIFYIIGYDIFIAVILTVYNQLNAAK